MNLDIVEFTDGLDLGVSATAVCKAGNVLSCQLGKLEYIPDFGVDFRYFLESPFQFQNAAFKSYLIERLTHHQINVSDVIDTIETLFEKFTFFVDNEKGVTENSGFIR